MKGFIVMNLKLKPFFNLNFQGNEKFGLFSQGTYDFQNLGNETV